MKKPFLFMLLILSLNVLSSAGQKKWHIVQQQMLFNSPPFAECHASTIVEVTPNKKLVAYFAGTEESNKDVGIWLSIEQNGKWNKPLLVAEGIINDTLRYPCWNPVLFKTKKGKLLLFYKVGPSPREWWGMVTSSSDNGLTWSKGKRLQPTILGPIKNKPIQLADGSIISPSSTETKESWKVHVERSVDDGETWQLIPVDPTTEFEVIQPTIISHADGRLQMLCRSKHDRIVEAFSSDMGKLWSPLKKSNVLNPNSGIDAVTLQNGWQLLVYNPTTRGNDWADGRAKLQVAVSKDGNEWTNVATLENETEGEFSYPAVIQTADGKVHITYTFNRKNIKHVVLALR